MNVSRYVVDVKLSSSQLLQDDVAEWLGFLCARDYLIELLKSVHRLTADESKRRAAKIAPHADFAIRYLSLARESPAEISFLPAYYCILNLLKIGILVGPHHAELDKNRWHGATYNVAGKDSHSILTETITIKKNGVIPLYYRTITSKHLTSSERRVSLRDVFPYLLSVGHEYSLVGGDHRLIGVALTTRNENGGTVPVVRTIGATLPPSVRHLRALRGFKQGAVAGEYVGKPLPNPATADADVRTQFRTHLLYRYSPNGIVVPVCAAHMELPEELPIALLFFYMSSVCRYRPEFLRKLRDTKYWPVLSAARTHCFYQFLITFWSLMQQKNYYHSGDHLII